MHTHINLALALVALSSVAFSAPLKYEAGMDPNGHNAMVPRIRETVPGELEALAGSLPKKRAADLASAKNGAGDGLTSGAKPIGGVNTVLSSKASELLGESRGSSSGGSLHTSEGNEERDLEFLSGFGGEVDTADESHGQAAEQTNPDTASFVEGLLARLEQDIADQLRRQNTNTPSKRNTGLLSAMGPSVEQAGVPFEEELFGQADPNEPRNQDDGARVTVAFGGGSASGDRDVEERPGSYFGHQGRS